jgi:hypothetical protein
VSRRLQKEREDDVVAAYEEWDGTEPVDRFAARLGISKQTLYNLLRRRGVPTKTEQQIAARGGFARPAVGSGDDIYERMARQALQAIIDENESLRSQNEALRNRLGDNARQSEHSGVGNGYRGADIQLPVE